jgi:hypothetical protein
MSYFVAQAASSQTFALDGTNSKAALISIPSLCGPIEYSIVENYSFATVDAVNGKILVQTNQEGDANVHSATFRAKLTNYPSVASVEIRFFITITKCTGVEITQVTGQPNYDYYYYSVYGSTFEIPYPLFSITPSCDVIVSVNPDLTNAVSFGSCLNDNVGISL